MSHENDAQSVPAVTSIGRRAVVIGSGIAGLAAAAALSPFFGQVAVLERDVLPTTPARRPGTPQDGHAHGLLVGGLQSLEALLPELSASFAAAGAVPVCIGQDLREEMPNGLPMPQRDFGMIAYTMSRALLEFTLRHQVLKLPNVEIRPDTHVVRIIPGGHGTRVTGVKIETGISPLETMHADLVVDASGRGQLTSALLQELHGALPEQTAIGMELGYTTALLDIPKDAPTTWKLALTHAHAPYSSRRAVLIPIENNRWMLTVGGLHDERPPGNWDQLLTYMRQFTTHTIYQAVRKQRPVGKLTRWGLAASVWRRFERLDGIPAGLLPIGDAICRFNPVYGQGMSVAAREAALLRNLLHENSHAPDPIVALGTEFPRAAAELIATPWSMAALPDLAFPRTSGERPPDLEESLQFSTALSRLAAKDASVQRMMVEVWHLLTPRSVLDDRVLLDRARAEMRSTIQTTDNALLGFLPGRLAHSQVLTTRA